VSVCSPSQLSESASGCPLFFLGSALLFQRLGRLFLFFFLSVHAFTHDSLLDVD
jgi:hypothetical protein